MEGGAAAVLMTPMFPNIAMFNSSNSSDDQRTLTPSIPGLLSSVSGAGLTLTWRDLSVWATKQRSFLSCGPKPEPTQILNKGIFSKINLVQI
jgi:hypothetical protein